MHFVFTLPLFFITEYFNKKDISIIQKILIPVIYIIIVAGLFSEIKSNIYLIVVFEVILHSFYTNNIVNKNILLNKKEYYINSIVSIVLSIFIYDYFISKVDDILPVASEFRGLLWFLVIIFLYDLLKNNLVKVKSKNQNSSLDHQNEYVVMMYAKMKNKYYKLIKSKEKLINRLTYAIMIYENYRIPFIYRKINNMKNRFIKGNKKYGIMQIESEYEIDDEKSIRLTMNMLDKDYSKMDKKLSDEKTIINLLKKKYGDEESINYVLSIYNRLLEFDNK